VVASENSCGDPNYSDKNCLADPNYPKSMFLLKKVVDTGVSVEIITSQRLFVHRDIFRSHRRYYEQSNGNIFSVHASSVLVSPFDRAHFDLVMIQESPLQNVQ
jgi:hypothetical protein